MTFIIVFRKGECLALALLDLSAAFNTINHQTLLHTRLWHHFGDHALKWFTSYLTPRTQSVEVNDALSTPVLILYGALQG